MCSLHIKNGSAPFLSKQPEKSARGEIIKEKERKMEKKRPLTESLQLVTKPPQSEKNGM